MPNPENFTPHRQVRIEDDLWTQYGALVGNRDRSADLKAYIQWKLDHPTADLAAASTDPVLDFLVRVRVMPDGRRAEIVPLPGTAGRQAEELRAEIRDAIANHFQTAAKPKRSPRR